MIAEIYIDNFRCLVNFRIAPRSFHLWLGANGTGKSSVLDALRSVQRILAGDHVEDVFSHSSLTRWDRRLEQTFEIKLLIGGDEYQYHLAIEYQRELGPRRIKEEWLKWRGEDFFLFRNGEAHLFRINRHTHKTEEGAHFSADWRRSVIPSVAERDDNRPLVDFRSAVAQWLIVQPIPFIVGQSADAEVKTLLPHAENFAQWYRHVLQESPSIGYRARESLMEVLPGFDELSLREAGETRRLKATFRIAEKDHPFDFGELSDGQRQLIMLYTILESLRQRAFCSVLLIDEPDNFACVREVQPWLDALEEICEEGVGQAIIISHHPEILNRMARGTELWFSRPAGAHAITKPFPTTPGLTPAETMARGWEDE